MDDAPIIRKYASFDEMKADEYRYWQSRPAHERIDAVEESTVETAYAIKGGGAGTGCTKTTKTFCPPSMPMALNTSSWAATPSSYHAQPRFTKDIDLFIKADPATRKRYTPRSPIWAPLKASARRFHRPRQLFSLRA